MTTIVILAFGTRGDVAPFTGLGAGLRDTLGVDVVVAAQEPYGPMVSQAGLHFRTLPKDTEHDTRLSDYGQQLVDGAAMRPSAAALAGMRDDLAGVGEAMAEAAGDADLLICGGPIGSLLGYHVAEASGIPSIGAMLQPASRTGDFAPPALTTRSFTRAGNKAIWRMGSIGEKVYTPLIDDLRAHLDLPARARRTYQSDRDKYWPVLYGFSSHLVPAPRDWRPGLHVTGYWWPRTDTAWNPPHELVDFLDAGPAPVFVGLGSTATAHGDELSDTISRALRMAGVRGIVQSGWAQLHGVGDDILTIDDVPHEWLFPRMAAAVHHCGAGTSAAALSAGIPSVPVTGIMDQPFWADRLHKAGAATAPLRRVDLTAADLAAAITEATTKPVYTSAAQHYSRLLADEDGVGLAARIVADIHNHRRGLEAPHGR